MMSRPRRAVILAEGSLGSLTGKTTNILIMYNNRKFNVVAVIDSNNAHKDAGEVIGIGKVGIPVVKDLNEAMSYSPEVLIIGIATVGGTLPKEYRKVIADAITKGLDIWSGLHYFLGDDPEFSELARKCGVRIHDIRKPPRDRLRIWNGDVLKTNCARILVAGTDCVVGKNVTVLELEKGLKHRGYNPGIVATGQTLILAGAHAGAVIDAIPSDFCPGVVEQLILNLDDNGFDPVIVEGQASVLHPAYGQVALSILYGSMPNLIVLAHDPWRRVRDEMNVPMEPLKREIKALEFLCPTAKVVAISIMGYRRSNTEVLEMCEALENELNLPVADPRRDRGRLVDAINKYLR